MIYFLMSLGKVSDMIIYREVKLNVANNAVAMDNSIWLVFEYFIKYSEYIESTTLYIAHGTRLHNII